MKTYRPENLKVEFPERGKAVVGLATVLDAHGWDRVTVVRRKKERLGVWMQRVRKVQMELAAEWNAINRALAGGDPDDPVVDDQDVPDLELTPWEIQALDDIGEPI